MLCRKFGITKTLNCLFRGRLHNTIMAYFIRTKGKIFGPFDESQLLEMQAKGKLSRMTEISANNKNNWQSAEAFPFLNKPVQAAVPEPLPPPLPLPPPSASASASTPAGWFYSLNGKEGYGPVTVTEIDRMIRSGQLNGKSYVWQQGENAGFIKDEPLFSGLISGTTHSTQDSHPSTSPVSVDYTGNTAGHGSGFQQFQPPVATGLFCHACGNPVLITAQICPRCGSPVARLNASGTGATNSVQKERLVYVFLALIFGAFGVHNFYANRLSIAVIQLVLGITMIGILVSWIWAVIDAISVKIDGRGNPMA